MSKRFQVKYSREVQHRSYYVRNSIFGFSSQRTDQARYNGKVKIISAVEQ